MFQSRGRDLLIGNLWGGDGATEFLGFQSRGRDLLIGNELRSHLSASGKGFSPVVGIY